MVNGIVSLISLFSHYYWAHPEPADLTAQGGVQALGVLSLSYNPGA